MKRMFTRVVIAALLCATLVPVAAMAVIPAAHAESTYPPIPVGNVSVSGTTMTHALGDGLPPGTIESVTVYSNQPEVVVAGQPARRTIASVTYQARRRAGTYADTWSGRDTSGRPVPDGAYTVTIFLNDNDTGDHLNAIGGVDIGVILSKGQLTLAPGTCRDPWIAAAIQHVANRAPRGAGESEECAYTRYGGGQWTSYADLEAKVRTALSGTPPDTSPSTPPPTPAVRPAPPAAATSVRMGGSAAAVDPATPISFTWDGLSPTGNDWVSLHYACQSDGLFLTWKPLDPATFTDPDEQGVAGRVTLQAPREPGTYALRLFTNGVAQGGVTFRVTGMAPRRSPCDGAAQAALPGEMRAAAIAAHPLALRANSPGLFSPTAQALPRGLFKDGQEITEDDAQALATDTPELVQRLTRYQVQSVPDDAVGALLPYMTPGQATWLTDDQIQDTSVYLALSDGTPPLAVGVAVLGRQDARGDRVLWSSVGAFLGNALDHWLPVLWPDEMPVIDPAQLALVDPAVVARLSADQAAALTSDHVAALTAAQIAALSPAARDVLVPKLTPDQVTGDLARRLSSWTMADFQALSTTDVMRLSGVQIRQIAGRGAAYVRALGVRRLTPMQVASLSAADLQALGVQSFDAPEQLSLVAPDVLKSAL